MSAGAASPDSRHAWSPSASDRRFSSWRTRVLARVQALTAAIWHNDKTAQPVKRSLIAFDY